MICGNKSDASAKVVSDHEAKRFMAENECLSLHLTSAATGSGVEKMILDLTKGIINDQN